MIHRVILAALLVLVSCGVGGVNENNWAEKSARVQCGFAKRCMALYFYYEYDDLAECEDE